MSEKVFFNENGYLVTNVRFEVPGQTYVMSGISSVKVAEKKKRKIKPIGLICFGFLLVYGGATELGVDAACFGLVIVLLGGLWLRTKKTIYYLIITTGATERRGVSSTNRKFMQSLRAALTNAIIDRG
jgi:hypothetical protein|tara:strand:+ start:353 stop:736 length:384 start_codon:yes stop_codon:yes gene_type:complete